MLVLLPIGVQESREKVTLHDIKGSMDKNKEKITEIFVDILSKELTRENCNCNNSIISL